MENEELEPIRNHLFIPGNTMWTQRSKHGSDKIFKSPQAMASSFGEYADMLEANPIRVHKVVVVAQEATNVYENRAQPFTWSGFAVFCGVHRNYFANFRMRAPDDFRDLMSQLDDIMFTQKFSGAAVGIFNANIISRDLGLIDKKQLDARHLHASVGVLTPEEAKAANQALEEDF